MEPEDGGLADVLAFLDGLEGDKSVGDWLLADSATSSGAGDDQSASDETSGEGKKRRRRPNKKYSTMLQRRKRAEIADLKEQGEVLKARLAQLRRLGHGAGLDGDTTVRRVIPRLEEEAMSAMTARRRAEDVNALLRKRLGQYSRLQSDIVQLIERQRRRECSGNDELGLNVFANVFSSVEAMAAPPTAPLMPLMPESSRPSINQMLEGIMKDVNDVFACLRDSDTSWLETKQLNDLETEIRMTTLAGCSVEEAEALFWPKPQIDCCPSLFDNMSVESGATSRVLLLPVRCRAWNSQQATPSGIEIVLHAEHYARRLYDPITGRVVLVLLALVRVPACPGEVFLREYFWKCISPAENQGEKGSVIQTCYRVGPGDMNTKKLSPVQASVMRVLVQLTRRNHAAYQERILDSV